MTALVAITLAGIKRQVPQHLLQYYQSFGWKTEQGANPEQSRTVKTTKRKSNEDRISK